MTEKPVEFVRDQVLARRLAEEANRIPMSLQPGFLRYEELAKNRWWVQPVEVVDGDGVGTGYWRMAASKPPPAGLHRGPFRLCTHPHSSPEEAAACSEARANQLNPAGSGGGYVEGIRAWSATLTGRRSGER